MSDETPRTKAEFRYIRERVGISHALMAKIMGCTTRSVRYWEDPTSLRYPPQDAWDMLDEALEYQDTIVEYTLKKFVSIAEAAGSMPDHVELPYWLSKAQYDEGSTDAAYGLDGDWNMANANARVIAIRLEAVGVRVEWVDYNPARPDGVDGINTESDE